MKKQKIVIGVLSVLAVVLIAVAAVLALNLGGPKTYSDFIELGDKYLDSGDYTQAISAYQSALDLDEDSEQAYEGLSRAYLGAGYEGLARRTLQGGIDQTGSSSLVSVLEELFGSIFESDTDAGTNTAAAQEKNDTKPSLNTTLLSFVSGAAYSDYKTRYGTDVLEYRNGVSTISVASLDVTLTYANTSSQVIINSATGEPYAEYLPDTVEAGSIASIFGGASTVSYEDLRNMAQITNLTWEDNTISFEAYGCLLTFSCDSQGAISSSSTNEIIPTGEASVSGRYVLTGSVKDAATGASIPGAAVSAYLGYGTYGDAATTVSDSSGNYSLELTEGGTYTLTVAKTGYITAETSVYVLSNGNTTTEDLVISQELAAGEMRIVLTWGASPSDLDSYLDGTTDAGDSVYTWFSDKTAYSSSGSKIAELDVDDTTGYGPETTTIYDINGVYEFIVVDFTGSGTMSSSGATVTVYSGNSVLATINICSGLENGWSVCKIDHGVVTVENTSHSTRNGRAK